MGMIKVVLLTSISLVSLCFIICCDEEKYLHSSQKKYFFNDDVVVEVTVKLDECQVEFLFNFLDDVNYIINVKNELTNETIERNSTVNTVEINSPYPIDFDWKYSGKWLISIERNGTVERQEYWID